MNIPIDKLAVFDIIKDLDCIVVVLAVSEEIFAQVTAMGRMSLMISALVLGAAILILWIVTASVVRPISQVEKGLKDAARGEGDLTRRLEVKSKDRVGSLARWFNSFVEKLQDNIAEVNASVKEISENGSQVNASASRVKQLTQALNETVGQFKH